MLKYYFLSNLNAIINILIVIVICLCAKHFFKAISSTIKATSKRLLSPLADDLNTLLVRLSLTKITFPSFFSKKPASNFKAISSKDGYQNRTTVSFQTNENDWSEYDVPTYMRKSSKS